VGRRAETFGQGREQFTIDFVPISAATNPTSGYGIVNHDYRIGTYDITNDQWNKFTASLGMPVTGHDGGYSYSFHDYGTDTTNVPANNVSWFEAAQFINWLNTSTGHAPAYRFTGTQGTSNYTFATWSHAEAADGSNLYRNKDAYYFLPTEDEWVKAAYWNGTTLQTYATKPGDTLTQGTGSGTGWNYTTATRASIGPWNVGSGSQELNGTYDMMGNVWQWMEGPHSDASYGPGSARGWRGGSFINDSGPMASSFSAAFIPADESSNVGFRVASVAVPEPSTLAMLLAGVSLLMLWRRHR
jgi:formylglycine-generating enzyme required for sulfatase activity